MDSYCLCLNTSFWSQSLLGKEGSWSTLTKRKFPRRPVTNTSRYPTTAKYQFTRM